MQKFNRYQKNDEFSLWKLRHKVISLNSVYDQVILLFCMPLWSHWSVAQVRVDFVNILSMGICNYFVMSVEWNTEAFVMYLQWVLLDKCRKNGAKMSCFVIGIHCKITHLNNLIPSNNRFVLRGLLWKSRSKHCALVISLYTELDLVLICTCWFLGRVFYNKIRFTF